MIHHALNRYFRHTHDTPKGLSEKTGVPLPTIYRLRSSNRDCRLETWLKLEPFLQRYASLVDTYDPTEPAGQEPGFGDRPLQQ